MTEEDNEKKNNTQGCGVGGGSGGGAAATAAVLPATTTAKKVRRAFSMPRNPFRWSHKYKLNKDDHNYIENNMKNDLCSSNLVATIPTTTTTTTSPQQQQQPAAAAINDLSAEIAERQETTINETTDTQQQQQQQQTHHNPNQLRPPPPPTPTSKDPNNSNNFTATANRIFRRSSFRKFLIRIANHVSSVSSLGANKQTTTTGRNSGGGGSLNNILSSDRVPPIGGYQWPPDQTPGVTGLKNHGNTCFMNAVLQCLSHTDILAEYFVLDQYKADLKRRNKINSKKFGTKGELTEQLANVLKALWTCKNETDHSTSFKAVVDRYGTQFRSSTQHDAQEFLFWLLDKVHEDLNTASKRRYKNVKNNYGRPDEVIAAETLANHIRCNNSFVQAVFQAQFRSSLTCPRCKKQSNTFDPFHCISVQLPQLAQQTIFVTVLYVKQHPRQVKLGLTVPAGSPIIALRERLNADTGIATNRMVLADINESGFSRVFYDSQPIATLDGINTIYCIEIPEIKDKSSTDLMLLIANVKKMDDGKNVERFGTPFCIQVNRDCSYLELQKKLLKEMSAIVKPEVFAYTTPLSEMFQIRLQDPSADPDTYLEQVEHPLFMEIIDMALSVLSPDAGPSHIKLLLEWTEPDKFFMDLTDPVVEHESVSILKAKKSCDASLTLEECLEHYTKAEMLSAEDAWRCPNCQQYLPVVKTLGLWSLPDILVVHFKRFRQQHEKGPDSAKLTTMVKFPLSSFDMSPHLARAAAAAAAASATSSTSNVPTSINLNPNNDEHRNTFSSPWRKSFNTRDHNRQQYNNHHNMKNKNKDQISRENRYDLYAVCYHQGDTLETGHYTAACKNPYDHQWYKFDDQRVTQVQSDNIQDEIVNNEAYILFYQRRKSDSVECSGSSSTASVDHWVSRIAPPTGNTVPPIQAISSSLLSSLNCSGVGVEDSTIDSKLDEMTEIEKPISNPDSSTIKDIQNKDSQIDETNQVTSKLVPVKLDSNVLGTVVAEKTNESAEVDIEGLEYADKDDSEVCEILVKHINDLNEHPAKVEQIVTRIQTPDIPKAIETKVICNNSSNASSNISSSSNSSINSHKLMNGVIHMDNCQDILMDDLISAKEMITNKSLLSDALSHNGCIWRTPNLPPPNSKSPSSESILSHSMPQRLSTGCNSSALGGGVNIKDVLSSSLRSNHSGGGFMDSSSFGSNNNCGNLRHSFSTSSSYKWKDCDTISMLRNTAASTCSKDTLMFIDQQGHSIMDDDDSSFLGSRSLWISPVTPHKLITVSPKN